MTLDDDLPPILTVEQTATLLGISRGLAFAAVRTGEIPHVRIGRRIIVPRDALRDLLEQPRRQSA
ncbi:MAG: Helix-turn-helix domain [Pseudonocardiales bacterium]|jgi:excisionase family DNA binding protein|nr:Helix-turn-helix domain [Pseudonocardiales bacterium]